MSCATALIGRSHWSATRDRDGHREYRIVNKVKVNTTVGVAQGPATALSTPGLPIPGSLWSIEGDIDLDAVCQFDATVTQTVDNEQNEMFLVEQLFTTKPNPNCIARLGTGTGTGNPATDPLNESPKISGGFVKYTEEYTNDRNGDPILNSAWERLRGPQTEFDKSRVTIRIQQNHATLGINTLAALIDTVNGDTLWGFAARCVKLSDITYEQLYSADCDCYFKITYEFEVNTDTFDRDLLDEATKVLNGYWDKTTGVWTLRNIGAFGLGVAPDPNDPTHFIRLVDFNGNPMRGVLNGAGEPVTDIADAGLIHVEAYDESDFLTALGIPDSLECT